MLWLCFSSNENLKDKIKFWFWTWEKGVQILTVWKTVHSRFLNCRKCYSWCCFTKHHKSNPICLQVFARKNLTVKWWQINCACIASAVFVAQSVVMLCYQPFRLCMFDTARPQWYQDLYWKPENASESYVLSSWDMNHTFCTFVSTQFKTQL